MARYYGSTNEAGLRQLLERARQERPYSEHEVVTGKSFLTLRTRVTVKKLIEGLLDKAEARWASRKNASG